MRTTVCALLLFRSLAAAAAVVQAPAGAPVPVRSNRPSSLSAVGTIESFEARRGTLTLRTAQGIQTFIVRGTTHVRHGSKPATPSQLADWRGMRAKVRYAEVSGVREATSVMVEAASRRAANPPS